jgi:hypothetical protein
MATDPSPTRRERVRASMATFKERERERGTKMPSTFREAVSSEMGQAFSSPYQIPITVVANAVLMAFFWFLVPRSLVFEITSPLAFPIILSSWMYSDVPATNVLAPDRVRSLAALDDPKMLNRLLSAKLVVLWIFVAPFCSLLAILSGIKHHNLLIAATAILAICVVPIGCLPIAGLVGIRWPYHPLELKYRWENRKPFRRMIVRWTILILLPYGLVPFLSVLMTVPAIVILVRAKQDNSYVVNFVNDIFGQLGIKVPLGTEPMTQGTFVLCVVVTCGVALLLWAVGRWSQLRLIARRKTQLHEWLSDPTMG